jgi:hypothetical protein
MGKLSTLAAFVCLISCIGVCAEASGPTWATGGVQASHYVGPSQGTNDGDAHGIVGMNALCQAAYGPTAHMCNVDEFFTTAAFTKSQQEAPTMWVEPIFHECYLPVSSASASCRIVGVGRVQEDAYDHSCNEWTYDGSDMSGLTVWGNTVSGATLTAQPCAHAYSAACCVP